MIISIMKYFKGYLKIRLIGFSPERFLNLCSNHDILIWNLESHGDNYEFCMSIQGFRRIKPILKKTKTRLVILERHGLPFFLHKYRKRKGYFFGVMLCIFIIYFLSLFIWDIQIIGNYSRTTDVILDYLEENNVNYGSFKSQISCEEIETMIRKKFNDIIWASAEIKGTRLMIQVKENTDISVSEELTNPSDLVADKPGIITKIITRTGSPMFSEGDIIKPGDIIISGRVDVLNENGEVISYLYNVADGDIYIKTYYDYQDEFPLSVKEKKYTDEIKKYYNVKILNKKINLLTPKIQFEKYDIITEDHNLKLSKYFYLPISIGISEVKEYSLVDKKYTKEEAKIKSETNFNEFCKELKDKGVQIIENDVKISLDDKVCKTGGKIQVIEKIGIRVPTEVIEIPVEEEEGAVTDGNH